MNRDSLLRVGIILGFCALAKVFLTFTSHFGQGVCLVAITSLNFVFGVILLTRRKIQYRWRRVVGLFYIFWALADFGWSLGYFFLDLNSRSPSAVWLTESFYCAAFLSAVAALLLNFERPLSHIFRSRVMMVAILVATPVAARLIVNPFLGHSVGFDTSLFGVSETVAISSSYLMMVLAFVGLISSQDLAWTEFCTGLVCVVFADWAMRVDKILGKPAEFGVASLLAIFGLYFSSTALIFSRRRDSITAFDSNSLFCTSKLWMLLVVFIFLAIHSIADRGSLESLKTLCLGSCFGSLVAVFASEFITSESARSPRSSVGFWISRRRRTLSLSILWNGHSP